MSAVLCDEILSLFFLLCCSRMGEAIYCKTRIRRGWKQSETSSGAIPCRIEFHILYPIPVLCCLKDFFLSFFTSLFLLTNLSIVISCCFSVCCLAVKPAICCEEKYIYECKFVTLYFIHRKSHTFMLISFDFYN